MIETPEQVVRTTYRELSEAEKQKVGQIKSMAADMIRLIWGDTTGQPSVYQQNATARLEESVMWAVKGITGALAALVLVFGLAACSGGKKHISWPMESEIQGKKYHYHNAVQLDVPVDTFHAVSSWSWMEVCATRLENPVTQDEYMYPFNDCKMTMQPVHVPLASAAQQMITPVAVSATNAGGMVGLGYFIGDGLKKSGTTVNQSGGGASSKSDANAAAKNASDNVTKSTKIDNSKHSIDNSNTVNTIVK